MTYATRIEAIADRQLARNPRLANHFTPGQHAARRITVDGEQVYQLSYVDQMGHAVVVHLLEDGDDWVPFLAYRGGQILCDQIPVTKVTVSDVALDFLRRAKAAA